MPAEVSWQGDTPVLSSTDIARGLILVVNRRCAVCGYEIPAGSNCYRAFSQADAARMRGFERERSNDYAGPAHLSCMLFSAITCPYLRDKSTLLANNLINPGGSRGTLATVFGFENFGVLVTGDLFDPNQPPMFGYYSMIADHRYREGDELAGLLEEAIVTDRPVIAASAPPLFWDESPGAQSALRASATRVHRILSNMEPAGERIIQGFGRYLEYEM
ncbi:hypothetical protein [Gordonia sp. CNJ-863]|uniref:hypothetical protein n=1 Tax=Gordonia sp. CNJ-863 TaxID=1904963 RepID=UPI0011153CB3|nr:hypothetical protein [Gordonia sp. CNJ-863]